MSTPIENIKLSQKAKEQLSTLKRHTGIKNWNILCRWGFCTSLREDSIPSDINVPADSSVEMTWRVFGGQYAGVYLALLKQRCHDDGLGTADDILARQFRLHLHRGIAYLAADKNNRSIADLVSRATAR